LQTQSNGHKQIGKFDYFLVGWHNCTLSFPLFDIIFAQLACPTDLDNVIFVYIGNN
jgi:hypothetical protein